MRIGRYLLKDVGQCFDASQVAFAGEPQANQDVLHRAAVGDRREREVQSAQAAERQPGGVVQVSKRHCRQERQPRQ
jgi:hypothetical protein